MAKKGFDLSELAREAMGEAAAVSKTDTIQAIPAADIRPNEANFYAMSDLADLAASIELTGLLHPCLVKRDGDGYVLIDGERRYRAMTEVLGWTEIPSIVRTPVNAVLEELMLIEANRQQRKMSAADLSKQAERYMELLAELKKTGVKIPGRLRDAVADALQVSASKLARLSAIRKNLEPGLLAKFDEGKLNESVAYELQKLPKERQPLIGTSSNLTTYEISDLNKFADKCFAEHPCHLGGSCDYGEVIFRVGKKKHSWSRCLASKQKFCCSVCDKRFNCKSACPKLADTIKKEAARNAKKLERETEAAEAKRQADIEAANSAWAHLGELRRAAGIDIDDRRLNKIVWGWTSYETRNVSEWSMRQAPMYVIQALWLPALADLFHCSIDELFGRAAPVSKSDTPPSGLAWQRVSPDNMPPKDKPVILWGDGGLRNVPQNLIEETIQRMPETVTWWAVVNEPEEN